MANERKRGNENVEDEVSRGPNEEDLVGRAEGEDDDSEEFEDTDDSDDSDDSDDDEDLSA